MQFSLQIEGHLSYARAKSAQCIQSNFPSLSFTCSILLTTDGQAEKGKSRVSRGDWLGNAANFKRPAYCFDFDVERRSHVTSKVHKFSRWRTWWTIYLCLAMISRRF